MAGNEVCLVDVVRRLDGLVAETQVRDGDAAGLLGVVLEVRLDVLVGVVADDLDGVLVCADRAVAAETPELAGDRAGRRGVGRGLLFEGVTGDIIDDADGEVALRLCSRQVLIDCKDACRGGVLRTETVTTADDLCLDALALQRGDDIEVERLAEGAGLLGSVENGDLLHRLRQCGCQSVCAERSVQSDLDKADLLALCGEVVDDFLADVADRAHRNDDALCIRCAVVVEQLIVGADLGIDLVHVLLDDRRECIVILVACFSVLEEDIAVFSRAAENRVLGVDRACTESSDRVHIGHFLQIVEVPDLDLLDLVRGAEAVKEVEERHSALDGCKVCNRAEVHDLLRVGLSQHCKAGLTTCVDVRVIAEDVQCMGCNAACGYMEHAGKQLARDLVHVRDHQEKTLRRRVGRRHRAGRKAAVNGTCRTCLRLHLHDLDGRAEDVQRGLAENVLARRRPLVDIVCHRAGGGDGVDACDFGKRIAYVRRGSVAIHGKFLSCHLEYTSEKNILY